MKIDLGNLAYIKSSSKTNFKQSAYKQLINFFLASLT